MLLATSQCLADAERASIAGVYIYEEGGLRFVLCLPENGSVFFSIYRSVGGKLEFVGQTIANPRVENDTFSIRYHIFRVDRVQRRGWPLRKEITQTRYTDDDGEDRNVVWRYERVCPL